jgi:hypothetical protein
MSCGLAALFFSCGKQENGSTNANFTRIDSLTEAYLILQDSMLHTWNVMAKDESKKLDHLHELLELMTNKDHYDQEQINSLKDRLEQLTRIRYSQKSMNNPHVVEEYDFASNSLITEVISLVESDPTFSQNSNLQRLTDQIKLADQRVATYREEYDQIVNQFNTFIDEAGAYLYAIDEKSDGQKKALFTSDED